MKAIRAAASRLLGAFRKKRCDAEMAEEMQYHLDSLIDRKVAAGMSPMEARPAALREFGGVEQMKELAREQRRWMWPDQIGQDVRFGLRMLRRNPGFSLLTVLCLTLGIGTNTAVFSWIEGILLRPFPIVANQERLVAITGTDRSGRNNVSWPDFQDLQKSCTLVDAFIADRIFGTSLSIGDRAERATGSVVSANYFQALGVQPILGRGFEPGEDSGRNAHPVTVISFQAWKDRYQGDPAIIGKTQMLNGVQHT